jgi:hypothetical protein
VALKGKAIPRQAALVEAMFMAELENLILTAGHDLVRRASFGLLLELQRGGRQQRGLAMVDGGASHDARPAHGWRVASRGRRQRRGRRPRAR